MEHTTACEARWTTRVVRSAGEFEALRDAWSALLAEAADPNVFMSHEWLHSWWTAYRPDAELALVIAEERGRVRGIAPLMNDTVSRAGLRARRLRFIGDGSGETDHMNLLTPAAERARSLQALLDGIAALPWDVAEFNQMAETAANTRDLVRWIERSRLPCTVTASPCPVRRLPPTHDALLAALPARLRTSVRSSTRKLRQAHTVEFGRHEDRAELDGALRAFFDNHESRWQGKGQAGAFSNPKRRRFYGLLTPRLLARGWLRFFFLKLDGRPVAQQYCFALDDTVMLLQEGFDFAHAQDNVGNVLRSLVFEHLIASGAACYDFLAGSSRHKQSWSDGTVNDLRIGCGRRSVRGWLFFSLPRSIERAKDRLRPWRDRLLALGARRHG
jgi:CelD/BcsL family acetyltransferase involved in cellulose biosynthesis